MHKVNCPGCAEIYKVWEKSAVYCKCGCKFIVIEGAPKKVESIEAALASVREKPS